MTSVSTRRRSPPSPGRPARKPAELHPLAIAMQEQWTRLNDNDLVGVRNAADLAARLEVRYRLPTEEAARQVREWAAGRSF